LIVCENGKIFDKNLKEKKGTPIRRKKGGSVLVTSFAGRPFRIDKIVALCFKEIPFRYSGYDINYMKVKHKDGNGLNSSIENLEFDASQKVDLAFRRINRILEKEEIVKNEFYILDIVTKDYEIYNSVQNIADAFGVTTTKIRKHMNERRVLKEKYLVFKKIEDLYEYM